MVYLITGKAGAGKSHYGRALAEELKSVGLDPVYMSGDIWRALNDTSHPLYFTDEGRIENLMSVAKWAADLEEDGKIPILAFVAPKRKWRYRMRMRWQKSKVIYIPGGELWTGSSYEIPDLNEQNTLCLKLM